MKKVYFDEEEMFAIAVFDSDSRKDIVAEMQALLPELKEDPDMHALVFSAMEKLKLVSDQEFEDLPITDYRSELEYMDEELEDEDDSENENHNEPGQGGNPAE